MHLLSGRRLSAGLLAAGLMAGASTVALAQDRGLYLGAEVGVNFVPDLALKTAKPAGTTESYDANVAGGGSLGYGFGNGVRIEEELSYRSNNASSATGATSVGGSIGSLAAMTNAYYDFNTGTPWTPYLGAGIGAIDVRAQSLTRNNAPLSGNDDWEFGYQGIAGVSYAVNESLSIKGDYHYLASVKTNLPESGAFVGNSLHPSYQSHALMIGFVYNFDQPKAPPPPPPAPMMAAAPPPPPPPPPPMAAPLPRSYMVFFDFDKSDLKPEAQAVLQTVAANTKSMNILKIDATGNTDTVGSDKYNMALSLRRANAVKAALVALGVPAAEIDVIGKGKTDLLVQTGDGVREPRNRRVEIVFQ
jgi:outer membrane protein OmpA-like peptidoglycan-associated protein